LILIAAGCGQPDTTTPSSRPSESRATQPQPGQDAPDFALLTFDGETVRLEDFRGKPLALNFWASWSPRCVSRASALDELYRKHGAQDLQVLGVGVDDEEKLRVRTQEIELSYPVGASAETGHGYGVTDLPHTFFISREGKIVASIPGGSPEECLEPGVEMALASKGSEEYNAARDRFDAARASLDAKEAYGRGNESLRQAQAIRDGGGDLEEERHRLIGEAIENYRRAVALKPDSWQALDGLGRGLADQARATSGAEEERLLEEAIENYRRAVALKPDRWEPLHNMGWALVWQAEAASGAKAQRLLEEAVESHRRAVALKPDSWQALHSLGYALTSLARVTDGAESERLFLESIEVHERALVLQPDSWRTLLNLGWTLGEQAHATSGAEAERLRRLALAKSVAAHVVEPKSYAAYNAACAHALLGEPEECREWLETAREFDALPPVEHMQSDPDLDCVRDEEWFQECLQR
jgi:peroxiredoxin/Flp pilus assembly protein TadD